MSRSARLFAWFGEAHNLRKFALFSVFFWLVQQVWINVWLIAWPESYDRYALHYVNNVSVAAMWVSALAWWQSTRVEERQIEAEKGGDMDIQKDEAGQAGSVLVIALAVIGLLALVWLIIH